MNYFVFSKAQLMQTIMGKKVNFKLVSIIELIFQLRTSKCKRVNLIPIIGKNVPSEVGLITDYLKFNRKTKTKINLHNRIF